VVLRGLRIPVRRFDLFIRARISGRRLVFAQQFNFATLPRSAAPHPLCGPGLGAGGLGEPGPLARLGGETQIPSRPTDKLSQRPNLLRLARLLRHRLPKVGDTIPVLLPGENVMAKIDAVAEERGEAAIKVMADQVRPPVLHDECGADVLDGPGRREAAGRSATSTRSPRCGATARAGVTYVQHPQWGCFSRGM